MNLTGQILKFSLLAAYGGPIESDLPNDERLDYDFFLGLQYDTE